MTAGGDLDVYDDNGDIVGRLVGLDSTWQISVEAPDGDVGVVEYIAEISPEDDLPSWSSRARFDSPDCTGNSYMEPQDNFTRSASGYNYLAAGSNMYRIDLNTTPSATAFSSTLDRDGDCYNQSGTENLVPAEVVATISTAYPFHLRAATSSPSAVPSGAVGIIAGVLGISGALLVRRRSS